MFICILHTSPDVIFLYPIHFAVDSRRESRFLFEKRAEIVRVGKTAPLCQRADGLIGIAQKQLSLLQTKADNIIGGGDVQVLLKQLDQLYV